MEKISLNKKISRKTYNTQKLAKENSEKFKKKKKEIEKAEWKRKNGIKK